MRILQSVAAFTLCTSAMFGLSASAAQVAPAALKESAGKTSAPKALAPKASAPRQLVVVVAEGLGPQVVELGSSYVKASSTEPDATVAFSDLKARGKTAAVGTGAWSSMRGVLKTAAANGYKTGLVTTGDVTTDAALLYDLPSDDKDVAGTLTKTTRPNFLAGGGRSRFSAEATKAYAKSGNTTLLNAEEFEAVDTSTIKGNVLALQSDGELSYALDHDTSTETGLGDLASLALQTLGGENSDKPYILVVHDTNIARALAAKDTPALMGEFRELDGIVADVLSTRSALDKPENLALAVVSTGAASFPKYTTEAPGERSNAVFITSQLTSSYAKATTTLKGATDEDLTTFATETYPGWKPSADARAKVVAGTMSGEEAVRASYETAIAIGYDATVVAPTAYVVGLETGDVVQSVAAVAATKTK